MKEILDAIEESVRRIVREEIIALAPVTRTPDQQFGEAVKQALMDKQWFDDYIKAEVATTVDDLAQLRPMPAPADVMSLAATTPLPAPATPELFLRSEDFKNAVADAICNHTRTTNALNEVIDSRIEWQNLMDETQVERMIDNAVDDYVEKSDMPDMDDYVTKDDLGEAVRSAVEDLTFTVAVD